MCVACSGQAGGADVNGDAAGGGTAVVRQREPDRHDVTVSACDAESAGAAPRLWTMAAVRTDVMAWPPARSQTRTVPSRPPEAADGLTAELGEGQRADPLSWPVSGGLCSAASTVKMSISPSPWPVRMHEGAVRDAEGQRIAVHAAGTAAVQPDKTDAPRRGRGLSARKTRPRGTSGGPRTPRGELRAFQAHVPGLHRAVEA